MAEQTIELSIPSHPRFLQLVRGMMKKVTAILSIEREQADYIILAVDEACSNIIRHSYKNDHSQKIDFLICLKKSRLDISIMDNGKPFEFTELPCRDPEEIHPGGLGIYIIRRVMDQVNYHRSKKGQNIIQMVKALNPTPAPLS
ncbi:MAG: ATP-binding protein [Desulfobacter sp.]|nr:ATP-binding protein [Desulfobacter sp.]WDP85806.1 MAG: ATP-binding protein [Desulfobacter sp.]